MSVVRKRGSVRFATYFKVQTYRDHIGAWSDIKGVFATEREAQIKAASQRLKTRIREISMEGTRIL